MSARAAAAVTLCAILVATACAGSQADPAAGIPKVVAGASLTLVEAVPAYYASLTDDGQDPTMIMVRSLGLTKSSVTSVGYAADHPWPRDRSGRPVSVSITWHQFRGATADAIARAHDNWRKTACAECRSETRDLAGKSVAVWTGTTGAAEWALYAYAFGDVLYEVQASVPSVAEAAFRQLPPRQGDWEAPLATAVPVDVTNQADLDRLFVGMPASEVDLALSRDKNAFVIPFDPRRAIPFSLVPWPEKWPNPAGGTEPATAFNVPNGTQILAYRIGSLACKSSDQAISVWVGQRQSGRVCSDAGWLYVPSDSSVPDVGGNSLSRGDRLLVVQGSLPFGANVVVGLPPSGLLRSGEKIVYVQ